MKDTLLQSPASNAGKAGRRVEAGSTGKRAFTLVCLVFGFEYLRPQDILTFLSPLRLPMIIGLSAIALWVFRGAWKGLDEKLVRLAIAFVALCALSVIFAPLTEDVYVRVKALVMIVLSGTLPFIAFASSPKLLLRFFRFWVAINLLLALLVIKNSGVGPGSFLSDENDVGLALLMGMPYVWYLAASPLVRTFPKRLYCYGTLLALGAAIVITGSRGTFVGLLAVIAYFWWNSKRRLRSLVIGIVGLQVLFFVSLPFLPDGYVEEMSSITDTSESTAQDRIRSWRYGLEMLADNPIFGVGAGNYPWVVQSYVRKDQGGAPEGGRVNFYGRAAHSVYFTVLPELGLTGGLLFLLIVIGCAREIRTGLKILEENSDKSESSSELRLYGMALGGSLVGFLSGGAFISVLYYPHIWWLIGFSIAFRLACSPSKTGHKSTAKAFRRKHGRKVLNTVK